MKGLTGTEEQTVFYDSCPTVALQPAAEGVRSEAELAAEPSEG